ncbi:MAG: GDYXXLXY domain-containing protein [Pseudomonadota bacterium]
MKWLRYVLLAHVLFFGLWGGYLLTSHQDASVIWLETSPIDPRDLLSGHFVALRFEKLENPAVQGCLPTTPSVPLFVRLEPSARTIPTVDGPKEAWIPVECRIGSVPESDTRIWMRGFRSLPGNRLNYGIDRFYVPETSALRQARSGQVIAGISINRRRDARITDLLRLK